GEMSIHHPVTLHGSNSNVSTDPRIGLSASYSAPEFYHGRRPVVWRAAMAPAVTTRSTLSTARRRQRLPTLSQRTVPAIARYCLPLTRNELVRVPDCVLQACIGIHADSSPVVCCHSDPESCPHGRRGCRKRTVPAQWGSRSHRR